MIHRTPILPSRSLWMGLILLLLVGCQNRDAGSLNLTWTPLDSLNATLPNGVQVYAGQSLSPPLKAWHVRVRVQDDNVRVAPIVSQDVDRRQTATALAEERNACVLVNGGYFVMGANPTRHAGLLWINGEMIGAPTRTVVRDSIRYATARATLGFSPDETFDVAWVNARNDSLFAWATPPSHQPGHADTLNYTLANFWDMPNAIAAGPALVANGRIWVTDDEEVFFGSSIPAVHPRTAAGYTRDGDLILLVVDGRQFISRGVDLVELATILRDLGAVEALNLDGGGSSTIVVQGQRLNRPAGGTIEREIMSAIAVYCD